MAENFPAIVTTIDGTIVVIRFNNPAQRNPLSTSTLQHLESTLSELLPRPDVKGVIFTGTDEVFASGANIHELSKLGSHSALQFSQIGQRIFQTIADSKQVTIAAISGFCMGGALDLALACDIRVASINATFAHPGARLGIITGWGGTQRLPRIIGRGRALKLFLTARSISSAEALQIGLVSSVTEDPLASARSIARGSIA